MPECTTTTGPIGRTVLRRLVVRRAPGRPSIGLLAAGGRVLPCALGRSGTTTRKREGDGATPGYAVLRPLWAYWRADRGGRPATALPVRRTAHTDGWCDAPGHPAYNRPVRLPFVASHETIWRTDHLYDICVVLDWNVVPGRRRNAGSAIFMHLVRPGYAPTAGCIALARDDLVWLLARMDRHTRIAVCG
ncbi:MULTISPECIES: L,D-transpeptidase family protein [unclassified Roseitalea]|uniref:L,D-transpeptidase family protein n=1 Tax=unclassified Roseitalea TaxID=2639107 RepID=UPI00273E1AA6|nr:MULTISPECIES: L,D-transpeptidase family protein [unclassified Roseitalea]